MKIITLVLSFILISICGIAQNRNELNGPEAKNYKPWKYKSTPNPLRSKNSRVVLKGPAAKNHKVWTDHVETSPVKGVNKIRKFGPAAKNRKIWMD